MAVTLVPVADLTGPTGPPGADSTVPGPPGADSTVPGPPGPAGQNALGTAPQQATIGGWIRTPGNDTYDAVQEMIDDGAVLDMPFITFEKHGAVGDGVTDDTAAVLATLAEAKAAGGGIVQTRFGKRYGCRGVITVGNAVHLYGTATRQNPPYANAPVIPGLVALDNTFQLKVGDWATDSTPGGTRNLYVDGNKVGSAAAAKKGLIRVAGVDVHIENTFAIRSGGDGIVYDGTQNSTVVGGGSTMNAGVAHVLDNGAGSVSFHGGYYGTSMGGALEFRDTVGETSFYPFGPSANTFFGTIWESYSTADFPSPHAMHAHLKCGVNNIFYGTNFTGGADNPGKATMLIDNTDSAIPNVVTFDSNTWWSATGHDVIRVSGSQMVTISGRHFCSDDGTHHATSLVCIDGAGVAGAPKISMQGEMYRNATVPEYRIINGGFDTQVYQEKYSGVQYRLSANQVISVRQPGDAQNRWFMDQNGLMRWFDAAGTPQALLQRQLSGTGLIFSGGKFSFANGVNITGPFETGNPFPTFATPGSTFTLDSSLRKYMFLINTVAMAYTLAISNPSDGREVAFQIGAVAAPTITWPANARFAGGIAPVPGVGLSTITLRYDATYSLWFEIGRTMNVPMT